MFLIDDVDICNVDDCDNFTAVMLEIGGALVCTGVSKFFMSMAHIFS